MASHGRTLASKSGSSLTAATQTKSLAAAGARQQRRSPRECSRTDAIKAAQMGFPSFANKIEYAHSIKLGALLASGCSMNVQENLINIQTSNMGQQAGVPL